MQEVESQTPSLPSVKQSAKETTSSSNQPPHSRCKLQDDKMCRPFSLPSSFFFGMSPCCQFTQHAGPVWGLEVWLYTHQTKGYGRKASRQFHRNPRPRQSVPTMPHFRREIQASQKSGRRRAPVSKQANSQPKLFSGKPAKPGRMPQSYIHLRISLLNNPMEKWNLPQSNQPGSPSAALGGKSPFCHHQSEILLCPSP